MSTLNLNKKGSTQECGTVSGGSNPSLATNTHQIMYKENMLTYPVREEIIGAFVVPGKDWHYSDQHGGSDYGIVIEGSVMYERNLWIRVYWPANEAENTYRVQDFRDLNYHPEFLIVMYEWSKNCHVTLLDGKQQFFYYYNTVTLIQLFVNKFTREQIIEFIEISIARNMLNDQQTTTTNNL